MICNREIGDGRLKMLLPQALSPRGSHLERELGRPASTSLSLFPLQSTYRNLRLHSWSGWSLSVGVETREPHDGPDGEEADHGLQHGSPGVKEVTGRTVTFSGPPGETDE